MMSMHRGALFALSAAATIALVSGCAPAAPSPNDDDPNAARDVDLVVAIDAGLAAPALESIDKQIAAFEEEYPHIHVKTREYTWTGTTFAAELSGGTLPDVFTVPVTDGKGLIEQGQVADISALVAELPYFDNFNPTVLAAGQNSAGDVLAVPVSIYGQALHYNRELFSQAGLDPDQPPTSWEELIADAKAISDATGQAGFASMSSANTGGWIVSTMTYALGGRMQAVKDGKAVSTVNDKETAEALEYLHRMRWDDDSMGANFIYVGKSINQDFAAGKIGMFIKGADNYTQLVQQADVDPDIYGLTTLPVANAKDAGVLGGGTLAAVNSKADAGTQAAAVKWIDFFYLQRLVDEDAAVANAKIMAETDQPVGVPQLPIFDKETYDKQQAWIEPYINVPQDQMSHYIDNMFDQTLVNEMPNQTQAIYALLDPVLQAVLTDRNADIQKLLDAANSSAQQLLDRS